MDEDVLLLIFDHLDGQDLFRCETVCSQWRNIFLSGIPWRRLFHRKIVTSPQFRVVWWNLRMDETQLETVHYRGLCKAIIQEVKEIDINWRTGNCVKTTKIIDFFLVCYTYHNWEKLHCALRQTAGLPAPLVR